MDQPCFWSLLSFGDLSFVYTADEVIRRRITGHTLFDLIHPEELAIARHDLHAFMDKRSLDGSITRCRIRDSFEGTKTQSMPWRVVDIALYVVTEHLVLALFHADPESPRKAPCGEKYFGEEHISSLRDTLARHRQHKSQQRNFHIIDSRTRSVLFAWPNEQWNTAPSYSSLWSELSGPAATLSQSTTRDTSCVREYTQRTSHIDQTRVQQILIDYGRITFASFDISVSPTPRIYDQPPERRRSYNLHGDHINGPATAPHLTIPYARRGMPSHISHPYIPMTRQLQASASTPPILRSIKPPSRCESCGTDSSPEWRRGPSGHKTLCNACGLRYSRSVARQGKVQQNTLPQSPCSSTSSSSSSSSLSMSFAFDTASDRSAGGGNTVSTTTANHFASLLP